MGVAKNFRHLLTALRDPLFQPKCKLFIISGQYVRDRCVPERLRPLYDMSPGRRIPCIICPLKYASLTYVSRPWPPNIQAVGYHNSYTCRNLVYPGCRVGHLGKHRSGTNWYCALFNYLKNSLCILMNKITKWGLLLSQPILDKITIFKVKNFLHRRKVSKNNLILMSFKDRPIFSLGNIRKTPPASPYNPSSRWTTSKIDSDYCTLHTSRERVMI